MKINRHNYEEFFLLYIDNELSAAEKNAVELFVQDNADLKAELNTLQQTVYKADAAVYENKKELLKDEFAVLQQNLLFYIDDELNAADKLTVEKLLKADSSAGKELALLQKTKLQPDTAIVFAHKKSLYRKGGGKVIGLPWRRIAAAAILLGFGVWATVTFINTYKNEVATAATKNIVKPAAKKQNTDTATPTLTSPQKTDEEINIAATITEITTDKKTPEDNQTQNSTPQNLPQQSNTAIAAKEKNKKPDNNLPKPDYEKINKEESNESYASNVKPSDNTIDKINSGNKVKVDVVNDYSKTETVNGYALNASLTESDAGENNDNKILYMDEDNVKKSKLGGFFRKVKRMVDRNTSIKTGNSIKVAGFDIAIK
ncbi:anti-sigma factor family protein [Ferruginibacter sp.]